MTRRVSEMALFDYDVDDFKNESNLLPNGEYVMCVKSAEIKDTKDKTGQYINASFEVLDGKFKGRIVFSMFNILNKSEKAQNIGRAQDKALRTAVNVDDPKALSDLYRRPFVGVVTTKKDDEYGDKNEVKVFKAMSGKPWESKVSNDDDGAPF